MSFIIVQLFFKILFVSYLAFIVFDNSHLKIRIKLSIAFNHYYFVDQLLKYLISLNFQFKASKFDFLFINSLN